MEPIDDNYYDLSDVNNIRKQIDIAKKYNIDGFIFYHYWFGNDVQALSKPAELLKNQIHDKIEYCFCWANHNWIKNWHGKNSEMIVKQEYGDLDEWKKHYKYLSEFFKDSRYIKIDNKPVIYLYNSQDIKCINDMMECWNELAVKDGFSGIYVVEYISSRNKSVNYSKTNAVMEFEPLYTTFFDINMFNKIKRFICKKLKMIDYQDYDYLWNKILTRKRTYDGRVIQKSCFSAWDNSARKGHNAMIVKNVSPEKFGKNFEKLVLSERKDATSEYIIINAWNEWSEGAILEPTKKDKYKFLEQIKRVKEKYDK